MSQLRSLLVIGTLSLAIAGSAQAAPLISGGVAEEGRAAIESRENAYSLKVTYAGEQGMFLSDVNVTIKDRAGNVVASTVTNGPIMLADLAPGSYTIESSLDGFSKSQRVAVGKGLKQITIRFPIGEENYDNNQRVSNRSYWEDESRLTRVRGGYSAPERAAELNSSTAGDASVNVQSEEYIEGGRRISQPRYEAPNYHHPLTGSYEN